MPRSFFGGSYMVPDAPNFNWESLESASGLNFTETQRAILVEAMHHYLRYLTAQHTAAQMKDVKHRCEGILKHTRALEDLLRLNIKNVPSDDYEINLNQAVFSLFPINIDRNTYTRLLIQLRLGATMALTRLHKEGLPGRPDKEGLDVTIRAWHAVYLEAGGSGLGCTRSGGSKKAKGPFLDLINEAFHQVIASSPHSPVKDDKPPTKDALAQRILAALKQPVPPR
jgi:hypothetical protein